VDRVHDALESIDSYSIVFGWHELEEPMSGRLATQVDPQQSYGIHGYPIHFSDALGIVALSDYASASRLKGRISRVSSQKKERGNYAESMPSGTLGLPISVAPAAEICKPSPSVAVGTMTPLFLQVDQVAFL